MNVCPKKVQQINSVEDEPLAAVIRGKIAGIDIHHIFSRYWSKQNCNQETVGTRCSHDRPMPFGLVGAPAVFQHLMNTVLADVSAFSTAYLDDVSIFSNSWKASCTFG